MFICGKAELAQELFLEVTFTVLVCDFAEVEEKTRGHLKPAECQWYRVSSVSQAPSLCSEPPHSSSYENWNKDAATVLYSLENTHSGAPPGNCLALY